MTASTKAAPAAKSLRERILEMDDLGSEQVYIEAWDETLTVRGLTAGEVEEIGASVNGGDMKNIMARLVVKVTTNGDGTRLFDDEDAEALGGKAPAAIKALFDAAQRVSGLDEEKGEVAKG